MPNFYASISLSPSLSLILPRYLNYLEWIQSDGIDPKKIKFADESHVTRKIFAGKRLYGLKNKRIFHKVKDLQETTGTLTLMTSMDPDQDIFLCNYQEENYNQRSFADFLTEAICSNYLREEDVLVIDNASPHHGAESWSYIEDLLEAANVTIIFLPAYSPELNPCELVFGAVKRHMRNSSSDDSLFDRLLNGLAVVSRENMINYYRHCIYPRYVLY